MSKRTQQRMTRRPARLRGAVLTLAAASALSTLGATPSSAQARPIRIDVRRGIEGTTRAFSPNPLTIVVESDRFFSGWIEVIAPNSNEASGRYRQPVELPAGTRKTLTMVSPRSSINAVRAIDRNENVQASAQIPGENVLRKGEPLVGLLSQEAPRVASVDIPIIDQPGRVVPVPAALLSLGWAGVNPLSHLVVDGSLLAALAPQQRAAIAGYAAGGGEVIIAASAEADLAGFAVLEGTSGQIRRRPTGAGSITAVMVPLADDGWGSGGRLWERVLRPVDIGRWSVGGARSQTLGQALRETGGFRRPTLGWLLFFVLAYVALVGPINFMVLSRIRRRELAWVTIPGVAVLFAVGAYIAGVGFRDIPALQGVAVRVLDDGGEQSEVALGVVPRRGSDAAVEITGDWVTEPYSVNSNNREGQRIESGRDGVTARFQLASGEVGTIVGARSRQGEGRSAGRLRLERNHFVGSVSNPLGSTLSGPRLFVGPASVPLGAALTAGADREVNLDVFNTDGAALAGRQDFIEDFGGFGGSASTGVDEPPSLYRRASVLAGLGKPGRAYLTGWVPLAEAREALGIEAAKGRALILVPVTIEGVPAGFPTQMVRSSLIATDGEFNEFDGFGGGPAGMIQNARRTVLRFEVPASARPERVRISPNGPNPWGGPALFVKRRIVEAQQPDDVPGVDPEGPVAIPQPPEILPNGGAGLNAQAYDFAAGRWVNVKADDDGSVMLRTTGSRRFLSEQNELYVRILSDFGQVFTSSMFTLEGVTA